MLTLKGPEGSSSARGLDANGRLHCHRDDLKPTSTTAASPTREHTTFNVMHAQRRHGYGLIADPEFDFLPVYL